jgi:hypothetical protein
MQYVAYLRDQAAAYHKRAVNCPRVIAARERGESVDPFKVCENCPEECMELARVWEMAAGEIEDHIPGG